MPRRNNLILCINNEEQTMDEMCSSGHLTGIQYAPVSDGMINLCVSTYKVNAKTINQPELTLLKVRENRPRLFCALRGLLGLAKAGEHGGVDGEPGRNRGECCLLFNKLLLLWRPGKAYVIGSPRITSCRFFFRTCCVS